VNNTIAKIESKIESTNEILLNDIVRTDYLIEVELKDKF